MKRHLEKPRIDKVKNIKFNSDLHLYETGMGVAESNY